MPSFSRRLLRGVPIALLMIVVVLVITYVASRLVASPVRPDRPLLVASGDWEPFVGPGLADGGPVTALVEEVLARQGYAAQISYTTWPLALQRTDEGQVAGAFPFVGSAERRDAYLLSEPLLGFEYVLWVRRDDAAAITGADDLSRLRVAHIAGYDYWPALDEAVGGYDEEFVSKEGAFAALAAGDVDVVPEGRLSGQAVLDSAEFGADADDFVPLDTGLGAAFGSEESLYFMVPSSSANDAFLRDFNRQLAEVKSDEWYAELVAAVGTPTETVVSIATSEGGTATLRDPGSGREVQMLRGTRAVVRSWPPGFGAADRERTLQARRVLVKVLDGPAAGRLLLARAEDLLVLGGTP